MSSYPGGVKSAPPFLHDYGRMKMFDFLEREGVSPGILDQVRAFRAEYPVDGAVQERIPSPAYMYYGKEIWEQAATALLAGENLLLTGPKATGKNVLAEGLAALFGRPEWDVSFHINTDAASLIGADTYENGVVRLRKGPIYRCAEDGGFGVLDEINMAKNESLAVLHAALDFRRIIDVPGYERIRMHPAARFIATMNYGYAGTRELNEALTSRFMVIRMPVLSHDGLVKLLSAQLPTIRSEYADQFASLFDDIRRKCDGGEISSNALDLRGLLAALRLIRSGLTAHQAVSLGLSNKCFDEYERQLVEDMIAVRIPASMSRRDIFSD